MFGRSVTFRADGAIGTILEGALPGVVFTLQFRVRRAVIPGPRGERYHSEGRTLFG
jgi:hypothetical protein